MIPEIVKRGCDSVLLVDGKPFLMLAGEVHNSDSSSPDYMDHLWKLAKADGMNTLLLPVTWELTEPEEGRFDFRIPDALIDQARLYGMKICFLWFGSFKNAECMYAPEWVKTDLTRFRRAEIVKGQRKSLRRISHDGDACVPYTSLSYLCRETMEADARAFSALMGHIRDYDRDSSTVIAVQVENETGLLGAGREVSDEADRIFASPVPEALTDYLLAHAEELEADIRRGLMQGSRRGSWADVFGPAAEEMFSAYHVASFVNTVAEAGKKEYPLPMTANCWLVHEGDRPGDYPTGGPVSRVHPVWDFCAQAIDVYCPDIYVQDFYQVCDRYTRGGRPLWIPESPVHSYAMARLAYTIGHYHAMCCSPFGFDDIGKPFTSVQGILYGMDTKDPALRTPQDLSLYQKMGHILGSMMPYLADAYGTDRLQAVAEEAEKQTDPETRREGLIPMCPARRILSFGSLGIRACFEQSDEKGWTGVLLALQTGDHELYVIGSRCMVQLCSLDPSRKHIDLLLYEEGQMVDGKWKAGRRLNGDEASFLQFYEPAVRRIRWMEYD